MGQGFGCGDEICNDWHLVVCSCVFCPLLSGCQVYGAFVAGVAAIVSVLAWACLGCSFLGFCFEVSIKCKNDETKPKT